MGFLGSALKVSVLCLMLFDGAFRPPAGTGYGKRASSAIEVGLLSECDFHWGVTGGVASGRGGLPAPCVYMGDSCYPHLNSVYMGVTFVYMGINVVLLITT